MTRIFVTGCPRSGTTLLQLILAQAAGLYTTRETHFFKNIMRRRPVRWIDRHVGLDPARVGAAFKRITGDNDLEPVADIDGIRRLDQACSRFDAVMCEAAARRGHQGWLEKSPEHMFYIGDIRRHLPKARFVHILRPGPDVVASLIDARRKYPEGWHWIKGMPMAVRLYNRYARVIRREIGKPDTFVMRYDDIVSRNAQALQQLAAFLRLDPPEINLEEIDTFRPEVVKGYEQWKVRKETGIVDSAGKKFASIFDESEQKYVLSRLAPVDDIVSG